MITFHCIIKSLVFLKLNQYDKLKNSNIVQ